MIIAMHPGDGGRAPDEALVTQTFQPPSEDEIGRVYLLVLQGNSSSLFHLPRNGVVLIGRGEEADLRIADESASRRHAKLIITDGNARIAALQTHTGTPEP